MDLVYLCRTGGNEELRYSLRSAQANLPHKDVWIFGGGPDWLKNVKMVPTFQGSTRYVNTTNAMVKACEHPDVSDPFILMNDDFFIMQPVTGIPTLNRGPVIDVIRYYERKGYRGSTYTDGMRATRELLKGMGFDEPLSYELHVPMVVHKDVMLKAIKAGSHLPVLHKRTVYGNMLGIEGMAIEDVKVYDTTIEIPQGPWLSSHDPVFHVVHPILHYLFREPSAYEGTVVSMAKDKTAQVPTEGVPVFSPNRTYSGVTAGVTFVNGNGLIPFDRQDLVHIQGWFREHGYVIGTVPPGSQPDEEGTIETHPAYDPSEHTVAGVLDYLVQVDPYEQQRVIQAEQDGKGRKTILKAQVAG